MTFSRGRQRSRLHKHALCELGVCAKQPEVSGLVFAQGCSSLLPLATHQIRTVGSPPQRPDRNHSILPFNPTRAGNEGWARVPCVQGCVYNTKLSYQDLTLVQKYNTVKRTESFNHEILQIWWSRNFTFCYDPTGLESRCITIAHEHHY